MSWRKGFAGMFAVIGLGYGLLKLTVPTEQQLYDRLSDAQKKEVDKRRASQYKDRALLLDFIKSNAESDLPAWDVRIPPHVQEAMNRLNTRPPPASYPRSPPSSQDDTDRSNPQSTSTSFPRPPPPPSTPKAN